MKKYLLLAIALFFLAPHAHASIAFVQSSTAVDNGAGVTLTTSTLTATVNANDLLVVFVGPWGAGSTSTVPLLSDTIGNTWTSSTAVGYSSLAGDRGLDMIWYAINKATNSSDTITANWQKTVGGGMIALEYSGVQTTNPLDQATATVQTTASTSILIGPTAALQGNDLVVGQFAPAGSSPYACGSQYNQRAITTSWGAIACDNLSTSTAQIRATQGSSAAYHGIVAGFIPASAPPAAAPAPYAMVIADNW